MEAQTMETFTVEQMQEAEELAIEVGFNYPFTPVDALAGLALCLLCIAQGTDEPQYSEQQLEEAGTFILENHQFSQDFPYSKQEIVEDILERRRAIVEHHSTPRSKPSPYSAIHQLIIHQQDDLIELDGFLLREGDRAEIRLVDSWVPGVIAHDDQLGWYFLTSGWVGVRLQTGFVARLISLREDPSLSV